MKKQSVSQNESILIQNNNSEIYLSIDGEKFCLNQENGWVTLSKYIEIYDIPNVNTILNWIARGVIPKENVITIPYLNSLKIIKAVAYEPRGYKKRKPVKAD